MLEDSEERARPSMPSAMLNPTPPGLPSKIDASTAAGSPMLPLTPVSPGSASTTPVRSPSRTRWTAQKPVMDPVIEDSSNLSTHSRQLPSPPASPDQTQPNWRSGRRPSLSGTRPIPTMLPTTLPFRPRSGTGSSLSLTSAFQTSVRISAASSADTHRYASTSTSTSPLPASRSRSSSVSVAAMQEPISEVIRPVEEFRRLSTTDIRHRHPAFSPPERNSVHVSVQPSRTRVRSPEPGSLRPSGHGRNTSLTSPAAPFSPSPLNSATPPPHVSYSRPLTEDVDRPQPSNVIWKPQHTQPQQQQPALVRRKDSLALRPLPPSAFIASPPNSPSHVPSTRSRSSSVRTERPISSRLPPLNPSPPLHFDHNFTSEEKERAER